MLYLFMQTTFCKTEILLILIIIKNSIIVTLKLLKILRIYLDKIFKRLVAIETYHFSEKDYRLL